MKIKLTLKELREILNISESEFPKYTTQIINLANQNSQGTRPKNVGQLSELIQKFPGKKLNDWQDWYLKKHPGAIKTASDKIFQMVENLKEVIGKIDKKMVEDWVKDLVIVKTFLGLKFQEAVLKKGSELLHKKYKLAIPEEESKGIDGHIGEIPVSIKPDTYKSKKSLSEKISVKIIYYEKSKDGLTVDYSELIK